MTANSMNEELALLAELQRDITARLRTVCGDMSEDDFEKLVREIAAVKIKYGYESDRSLKTDLSTILRGESAGAARSRSRSAT